MSGVKGGGAGEGGVLDIMYGRNRMGGGGVLDSMQGCSRMTIDPPAPLQCRDGGRRVLTDQTDNACTNREADHRRYRPLLPPRYIRNSQDTVVLPGRGGFLLLLSPS